MTKPETLDNAKFTLPIEERMSDLDNIIKSFVGKIGAKSHKFDIHHTMLFGTMFPQRFSIEIEFEDGRKYGQSSRTFQDCFDLLTDYIYYGLGKTKNTKENTQPSLLVNWGKYPSETPTEYGKYWVYRKGCDKIHTETWNGTGWAYNNNDITHWTVIVKPID